MRIALGVLQALLLLLIAPLLRGVISRLKARIQNRHGASVLRPYQDLRKLLRKEDLVSPTSSAVFRFAPVVVLVATIVATFFVPVLESSAILSISGDFVLLVYFLALARFFLMLGGLDGGSSFGGMGASREALVSTLAEAPLLLGLSALAIFARTTSISGVTQWTAQQGATQFTAVQALALVAMVLVAIAETGRIPVDNPTTHLELTMIHEAMVLEYSGPSLAFIELASALKLTLISTLLISLFVPWGIATDLSLTAIVLGLLVFVVKTLAVAAGIALIESGVAKLRMYLVPDFLGVSLALSLLAMVFAGLAR
ncbi:MAG: respiratory chain complex I subunit 1 family protein [Acidobacteriaceae bacterium]